MEGQEEGKFMNDWLKMHYQSMISCDQFVRDTSSETQL